MEPGKLIFLDGECIIDVTSLGNDLMENLDRNQTAPTQAMWQIFTALRKGRNVYLKATPKQFEEVDELMQDCLCHRGGM